MLSDTVELAHFGCFYNDMCDVEQLDYVYISNKEDSKN